MDRFLVGDILASWEESFFPSAPLELSTVLRLTGEPNDFFLPGGLYSPEVFLFPDSHLCLRHCCAADLLLGFLTRVPVHTKSLHSLEKLESSLLLRSCTANDVMAVTIAFSELRKKGERPVTLEK